MLLDPQSACGQVCAGYVKGRRTFPNTLCPLSYLSIYLSIYLSMCVCVYVYVCVCIIKGLHQADMRAVSNVTNYFFSSQVQTPTDKTKTVGLRSCDFFLIIILRVYI